MPGFSELLSQLAALSGVPSVVGVLLTAATLVVVADWRISVFALAIQYVLAGLMFSLVVPAQVAGLKVMVGLLICVIFFITARQISPRPAPAVEPAPEYEPEADESPGEAESPVAEAGAAAPRAARRPFSIPLGLPFRLLAALLVAVTAWQAAIRPELALPEVPSTVNLAVYFLGGLGLLVLGLTEQPLKTGMGLLTVLTGFELVYAALEPALAIMALLAAVDFSVALGLSYLAIIRNLAAATGEARGVAS